MKKIILILLFISTSLNAKTYYVDNKIPTDSNTYNPITYSAIGGTESAFKTIKSLNA